jgi:type IV pilus assembly protein PilA
MNNVFTAKLLQSLRNKKGNKGFTLIELLVVVIIIGVLAAVALPNLLAQVGKARETEGKNAMGTINRGQQAYHFEATNFTPDISDLELAAVDNPLGVAIDSQYYAFVVTGGSSLTDASVDGTPVAAQADGVRDYAGAIQFASASGLYGTVLCQGEAIGTAPIPTAVAGGAGTCASGTALK